MATLLRKHERDAEARERVCQERAAVLDERLFNSGDLTRAEYVELDFATTFWIFVAVSFLGLVGETLVSYPIDGIIKNRAGLIWGPFSPLYGLAGIVFTMALNRFWRASAGMQFAVGACAGGLVEGFGGFLLKRFFGIVAWSYLSHPLNFWGFTSVPMMMVWGTCGVLWFRFVLPVLCRALRKAQSHFSPKTFKIVTIVAATYMFANIAFTLVGFECWFLRLEGQEPITYIQQFFASHYDNSYMSNQFGALSMFPEISAQ